jgi:hypothetical protein
VDLKPKVRILSGESDIKKKTCFDNISAEDLFGFSSRHLTLKPNTLQKKHCFRYQARMLAAVFYPCFGV